MLKTSLVAMVLAVLAALPAEAQITEAEQSKCEAFGEIARGIMFRRQSEEPIQSVIALQGGNKLLQMVVLEAYDEPVIKDLTPSVDAIMNFEQKMIAVCLEQFLLSP